jgi:predicted O-linked N-acetylglucosamine transferase (SPINDLY family)
MAHAALFNLGVLLSSAGRYEDAIAAYQQAIELTGDFLEPRINLGTLLEIQGRPQEAIAVWSATSDLDIKANPHRQALQIQALNNMGRLHEICRQYPEAEAALARSLDLKPQQPDVIQHWVHLRQKQCKWPVIQPIAGLSAAELIESASPLAMLAHTDDPAIQLLASNNFARRKLPQLSTTLCKPLARPDGRLRIGYLSGDLCVHAVGLLMADVIEQHDRERFEIFAFDWSHDDGSAYQERLRAAFDHRHQLRGLPDEAAARLIAECGIDILIDLQGLSSGARPGILAMRPAPVQIGWLGFIGTSAMPWIDYVIADRFSATREMEEFFTEKILPMDVPLLPWDLRRESGTTMTRSAQGLPEDKFVFASFNNAYKLNPRMFACWMNILQQVPNSVLWLLDENPSATINLQQEAIRAGVDANRLIFSPRTGFADFIGRLQLADLFLDNHPYNAGSTARDAMYAGLPMLTLSGRSMVSRMAGSLLIHAGLPELVTFTHASYVDTAVALASDSQKLTQCRKKLAEHRDFEAVNSTQSRAQVRALEAALTQAIAHDGEIAPLNWAHEIERAINQEKQSSAINRDDEPSQDSDRVRLYQVAYSPDTISQIHAPVRVLNNVANPRPDWREAWPIRQFLRNSSLDENLFYGFLSPRFSEKTGLSTDEVVRFAEAQTDDVDVLIFSPQADMGAFFLNVFEQAEAFDPGFSITAQAFFDQIKRPVAIDQLVMDSRHIVFSNYLLAKPRFWREWLALNEELFSICEQVEDCQLRSELLKSTDYLDGVQRKVFLSERIASVILCVDNQFKSVPHPKLVSSRSATKLGGLIDEAIFSDALKAAMRATGRQEFRGAFARLRDRIIQEHLGVQPQ